MKRLFCVIALLALAACSGGLDRKLDGSSEKKFEASLEKIKKSAKPEDIAKLDEALLDKFHGTVSLPFPAGDNRKIAVKIVDDRGIESLKVMPLK